MTDNIKFKIDGNEYVANKDESIWDVAKKIILISLTYVTHLSRVIEQTEIVEPVWLKLKGKNPCSIMYS